MFAWIPDERRATLAQLTRFVASGVLVATLGITVYSTVSLMLRWDPQLANFLAYLVAVITGYAIHSRWSFGGHGGKRTRFVKMRFVSVSVISYATNSFWVWLLYVQMDLGRGAPILPMVLVTPALTFVLNRQWVFR